MASAKSALVGVRNNPLPATYPHEQLQFEATVSDLDLSVAQTRDQPLSPRLAAIVDALPLKPGLRVLEIGCGPGAAARAIVRRIDTGHVLGIDRSAKAIAQARAESKAELASGRLSFRQVAAEDFELLKGEKPYDIALAVRVGAFDGRHPETGRIARQRIRKALVKGGRLFIDGGHPLREISLAD